MPFDRVKTGDPFQPSAPAWNSMLAAAQAHELRQSPPPGVSMPLGGTPASILVRNDTGADVPRFGVLGIDGPIIAPSDNLDEFQGRIAVAGVAPTAGTHDAKFVVTQEPIADGAVGLGALAGVTVVQLTEGGLTSAGIVDGDATRLGPGTAATVLWDDGAATDAWAIVRLGSVTDEMVAFRVLTATQDGANKRWVYGCKRQAQSKSAGGFGGFVDDPSDPADYTLRSLAEYANDDQSDAEEIAGGARVWAVQVNVDGADPEWWIVSGGGGGGGGLPAGSGRYKVLQLDAYNEPIWDWVRAHN